MKVAIIGGGFSGMLTAYLLEKKGYQVTVFEKEPYIGGHLQTIVNKDLYIELGTVFCFSKAIKPLLLSLDIAYSERFIYRNFLDENFKATEHLNQSQAQALMGEINQLRNLLKKYPSLDTLDYDYIDPDLLVSLDDFLVHNNLPILRQVIAPHLSSFGFGDIHDIQAYYTFKIFNISTIEAFIRGDKLLSIDLGFSEVIRKLSQNISDIRYGIEVKRIENIKNQVLIASDYDEAYFDQVIVTTKLPTNVIQDHLFNKLMKKIQTNPYITCAYKVEEQNIVTTYYKDHLGKKEKIQFFHTFKRKHKTILIAYAYGEKSIPLINGITEDIRRSGIKIKHLITCKQWYIFPHLKEGDLSPSFYQAIKENQLKNNICLLGSLITKPSISNLYQSIEHFIENHFTGENKA